MNTKMNIRIQNSFTYLHKFLLSYQWQRLPLLNVISPKILHNAEICKYLPDESLRLRKRLIKKERRKEIKKK